MIALWQNAFMVPLVNEDFSIFYRGCKQPNLSTYRPLRGGFRLQRYIFLCKIYHFASLFYDMKPFKILKKHFCYWKAGSVEFQQYKIQQLLVLC